ELKGCEDVFDTWMDSSVSPLFNTYWERDQELFQRLYPMSLRPQSHDIIRTWAFYTLLREHLLTGERPWKDIMIHGFIMAPDGSPMHSSLGNVIDPLPILENYGADALRYYASTCSLGEDNAFREKDVKHGRKLLTKLWNIGRFVGSAIDERPERGELRLPDTWILSRFSGLVESVTGHYDNYQFDQAMRELENFAWHTLADHYIEMIKYRKGDQAVAHTLYTVYLGLMKMFSPVLPHVTEEVYQEHFRELEGAISIHVSGWPEPVLVDRDEEERGEFLKEVISAIRSWKSENGIALNQEMELVELIGEDANYLLGSERDILETVRARRLQMDSEAPLEEKVAEIRPRLDRLGPEFKGMTKEIVEKVGQFDPQEIAPSLAAGTLEVQLSDGSCVTLSDDHFEVRRKLTLRGKEVDTLQVGDMIVAIQL
ncbi:MAG: class I tRNA ligase family protein, partial [Thermoplasmatota archaeon]